MKILSLALTALVSSTALAAGKTEWKSVYTNVKKECVVISSSNDHADIDFFESDCKSFGGYRLQMSGFDSRSAPTLSYNGEGIEMGRPGAFHSLDSDNVEWMYRVTTERDGRGAIDWKGFIYRLSVSHGDGSGSENLLYAVRLDGEKSCLLGNPQSNQAARDLVMDLRAPCVK